MTILLRNARQGEKACLSYELRKTLIAPRLHSPHVSLCVNNNNNNNNNNEKNVNNKSHKHKGGMDGRRRGGGGGEIIVRPRKETMKQ